MEIRLKKMREDAILPKYMTPGAACFDLVSPIDIFIHPGAVRKIPSGWAAEVPIDHALLIFPRSGISSGKEPYFPNYIPNSVGVIDPDFRGEFQVTIVNNNRAEGLRIERGDRVAQASIVPMPKCCLRVVDCLTGTQRGTGGFGHTGVNTENLTDRADRGVIGGSGDHR